MMSGRFALTCLLEVSMFLCSLNVPAWAQSAANSLSDTEVPSAVTGKSARSDSRNFDFPDIPDVPRQAGNATKSASTAGSEILVTSKTASPAVSPATSPAVPSASPATSPVSGTLKTAEGVSRFSTGLKVVGFAGMAIDTGSRIYTACHIERQYKVGEITRSERRYAQIKNAAEAVGSYAGACISGWAGFVAGASIGSAVPVIGTAVGGFVGGLIGGILGCLAGKKAADETVDSCLVTCDS